jgi:hypothetical protein
MFLLLWCALIASACGSADAADRPRGNPIPSMLAITPVPRAWASGTQAYTPGPSSIGGTVVAIHLPRLVLRTVEEGDVWIDTGGALSVWRETELTAAALREGDELFASGYRDAGVFHATNVWANIGRLDGTILAITGGVLRLSAPKPWAPDLIVEAELSRFVVHEGPWRLSDLHPGMTIGAVVYWDRTGLRRITRIW